MMRKRQLLNARRLSGEFALIILVTLLAAMLTGCRSRGERIADSDVDQELPEPPTGFLADYWQRPIPSQGAPPSHLPEQETSLEPLACAKCHQSQYNDWSKSLHSRAMGPGIIGQFKNWGPHLDADIEQCMTCHAPMSEQFDLMLFSLSGIPLSGSTEGSRPLHESGLLCAGCHVRNFKWYGPARRAGLPPVPEDSVLPHGGFEVRTEFTDSRFCICHQFQADERSVNGKLIQNTYEEWRASSYPSKGITCQSCHMPDRRHFFKGIHDAEMTRNGLEITSVIIDPGVESLKGKLVVKNSGVGHHFPTYITPLVYMNIFQRDENDDLVTGTFRQMLIGRYLPLDLESEEYDTRIPAGDSAVLVYDAPRDGSARKLVFRVWVSPDEFYNRFFKASLSGGAYSAGHEELTQALRNTEESTYLLYESVLTLD